jgi:bifunctional DNA-binding transcriptional regulator/antitoxin component of YhaV-PrlF toxin-antitoxin module
MALSEMGRVGRRGVFVIPASLRRVFGLDEGTLVIAEARPEGILLRPALAVPLETYTLEQKAAYLLENAVDDPDYEAARRAVRKMGLDPDAIPHARPDGKLVAHPSSR